MITRMMRLLRSIVVLRYAHLCMGLLALYGVSYFITYTSQFEKVKDTLKWYCYADYDVRSSHFQRELQEAEFYKEKYKEKLSSLTEGLFDYRDKKEAQAFFMPKGFLYDVWRAKNHNSYLLAPVIKKGHHKAELPEKVTFDYFILGNKKIVPFSEYEEGRRARVFVSTGEKGAYIHKDSIDYLLEWYFDSLWESEPRNSKGFYIIERGYKEPLTYFLYRDLREICEDIFEKRFYRNKKKAKQYFMEEGFKVFLPTMLAMGARMAADHNSNFPPDYKYLRACLTGLSSNPNYTMLWKLKTNIPNCYNPLARKGWKDFSNRFHIIFPDEITLGQISKMSQEILENVILVQIRFLKTLHFGQHSEDGTQINPIMPLNTLSLRV